jgi:phage shock protein PspC (stress-responsive transcriptional regulator)
MTEKPADDAGTPEPLRYEADHPASEPVADHPAPEPAAEPVADDPAAEPPGPADLASEPPGPGDLAESATAEVPAADTMAGERPTTPPPTGATTPPTSGGFPPPPPPPGGFPPPPPPPPGGFPPGGFPPGGFPPPPPGGYPPDAPFAARYGLVRPLHGRMLAGVCAAIGRATNTDPVLWRVLLAVLTLFGGVGLLLYLVGWLLIPAEGDSASAVEALLGRGRSSTSGVAVVIAAVLIVLLFGALFRRGPQPFVLIVALLVGAALLLARGGNLGRPADGSRYPPPPPGYPARPPYEPAQPFEAPSDAGDETATVPPATGEGPTTPAYRPPFAPHGPYAGASPYAESLGYSPAPLPAYPGLAGPPAVPPRRRPPSRLGRVTISLVVLALGVLTLVDVAGADIGGTAYLAVALAAIGVGLVVGAWFGRARWLILPGILLALALGAGGTVRGWHGQNAFDDELWAPGTVSEIDRSYHMRAGDGTLDLSQVDFTDRSVTIDVTLDFGNLEVVLPPNVDAEVATSVDFGNAKVFGAEMSGVRTRRTITDNGADGAGGGRVVINAKVREGNLEVHR